MFSLSMPGNYPTIFKIQIKHALNVKPSLSCADRAHHPRLLEYRTRLISALVIQFCYVFIHPWAPPGAEAVSDSYLHPSCPTTTLNKCLMNDGRKECSSLENCSSEPCTSALLRDVFIKCGFSVSVSDAVLIHPEAWKIQKSLQGLEERHFIC